VKTASPPEVAAIYSNSMV